MALPLIDVERRLSLFALAIAGHDYQVRADTEFKSAAIAHRAGLPLSDAETLYLPAELGAFDRSERNFGAYRVMALHQLGYREFGSLSLDVIEARRRLPALARRPMPDAAPREPDLSLFFRHFEWPAFARALFAVIEGIRIDARMLHAYPGIRGDWERCQAFELATRVVPSPCVAAADYLEGLICWSLDDRKLDVLDAADATGALGSVAATVLGVTAREADVYVAAGATERVYAIVESLGLIEHVTTSGEIDLDTTGALPAPPSFHGEAPGDWQQREERLEEWEDDLAVLDRAQAVARDAPVAAMEHAESAPKSKPGDVRSGKVVTAAGRGERDALARRIDIERSGVRHALGRNDRPHGQSFLYDEWDMHQRAYRRGWCRLYESGVETGGGVDVRGLSERVAPHRAAVQRRFAEIRPRGYSRVRRVLDGEDLDIDELIDYVTEKRRGNDVDERVYRRRDRLVRDVAAAFLLDLSASTDDPVVKPEPIYAPEPDPRHVNLRDPFDDDDYPKSRLDEGPPPRRIIDVLREALLLMASALEHHRDHWGLYGFSGYGRDNVEYYVVKELGARFGYTTLEALAALKPRRSTRMGPAIRHSTWKLKRTASPLKVLIVVSDGFPQDCDYGPDRADHEYGVQDTAKALEEAQRTGIETFCVTVDRAGHDYLKRMCPDDRYLVIDELEALPLELTKVYQKLTAR